MKFWKSYVLAFSFLTLAPYGMAEKVPNPEHTSDAQQWAVRMQEIYGVFSHLLTDISSESTFRAPENRNRIIHDAESLVALTHSLSGSKMTAADQDPTLAIVGRLLHEQTEVAVSALKQNKLDFARRILRTVPSYCMSCHTRNATGPQFSKLDLEPSHEGLTPIELGQFYAASRQFDRALEQFKLVRHPAPGTAKDSSTFETAVHQSLMISVRVKQNAKLTKEIVDDVLKSPLATDSLKADALAWSKSVKEWDEETLNPETDSKVLLSKVRKLLDQTQHTQNYSLDRSADILYLRASAMLHSLLQKPDLGDSTAEALYLAGRSYEVLRPIGVEDLQIVYYEACILRAPHTTMGEKCFHSYKESIVFGFSGSGGIHIPESVKTKLAEMETLSHPQKHIK